MTYLPVLLLTVYDLITTAPLLRSYWSTPQSEASYWLTPAVSLSQMPRTAEMWTKVHSTKLHYPPKKIKINKKYCPRLKMFT